MRRSRGTVVGAALVVISLCVPTAAHAQSQPALSPPGGEFRPAVEALASELSSLAAALPVTSERRVALIGAWADLRLALGDTTGALAAGALAPARVLVGAHRDPICAAVVLGDLEGALAYAARFTPRARRDGSVAWIAWAMARGYHVPDSVALSTREARHRRALQLAEGIEEPLERVGGLVGVGIGGWGARDTAFVREAARRARRALPAIRDSASRATGARVITRLMPLFSSADSVAWRREAGSFSGGPLMDADTARPRIAGSAHDSALTLARDGHVAAALRVAGRVRDRYGFGVRAETLLEIGGAMQWQLSGWQSGQSPRRDTAGARDTVMRILRMAAREAATGRDSATREGLLRRVAEAQIAAGLFTDALATAERMRDWHGRGQVAGRAQEFHVTSAEERADGVYRTFLAGLTDPRSRDVLRLHRVRALRHFHRGDPHTALAVIADSMESATMRPVGVLTLQFAAGAKADPRAIRAALLALQDAAAAHEISFEAREFAPFLSCAPRVGSLRARRGGTRRSRAPRRERRGSHEWMASELSGLDQLHALMAAVGGA